jgi:SNF2 family DNA or RNA helicase
MLLHCTSKCSCQVPARIAPFSDQFILLKCGSQPSESTCTHSLRRAAVPLPAEAVLTISKDPVVIDMKSMIAFQAPSTLVGCPTEHIIMQLKRTKKLHNELKHSLPDGGQKILDRVNMLTLCTAKRLFTIREPESAPQCANQPTRDETNIQADTHATTQSNAPDINDISIAFKPARVIYKGHSKRHYGDTKSSATTEINLVGLMEQSAEELKQLETGGAAIQVSPIVATSLFKHQREGLFWMLQREKSSRVDSSKWAGKLPNGGIVADDMGLGKTLQMIALISTSGPRNPEYKGGTLILCPVSLADQWEEQIATHTISLAASTTENRALRVLQYRGSTRHQYDFSKYDVVIASLDIIKADNRKPDRHGIARVPWRRIVIDEAHLIRSHDSERFRSIMPLQAESRWVLTGTPLSNGPADLFPLFAFLRFPGVKSPEDWRHHFPKGAEDPSKLQRYLRTVMLRRTKTSICIELPPRKDIQRKFDFSSKERELYDWIERFGERIGPLYGAPREAMTVHTALRQVCNCPSLLVTDSNRDSIEYVLEQWHEFLLQQRSKIDASDEKIVCHFIRRQVAPQLVQKRKAYGWKDALIALSVYFTSRALNKTGYGQDDTKLQQTAVDADSNASEAALGDLSDIFGQLTLKPKQSVVACLDILDAIPSTKMDALVQSIHEMPQGDKGVVFSQWTKCLDAVEQRLQAEGIGYTRIDGKQTQSRRTTSLGRFRHSTGIKVLLASLKVADVGLNLNYANHAFVYDLSWNPQTQKQAVDRIYRIGQKQETFVHRMLVNNTVEAHVAHVQQEKLEDAARIVRPTQAPKKHPKQQQQQQLQKPRSMPNDRTVSSDAESDVSVSDQDSISNRALNFGDKDTTSTAAVNKPTPPKNQNQHQARVALGHVSLNAATSSYFVKGDKICTTKHATEVGAAAVQKKKVHRRGHHHRHQRRSNGQSKLTPHAFADTRCSKLQVFADASPRCHQKHSKNKHRRHKLNAAAAAAAAAAARLPPLAQKKNKDRKNRHRSRKNQNKNKNMSKNMIRLTQQDRNRAIVPSSE